MRLSKHDLFQTDDDWLKKLPAELLLEVSKRLLHDVKELHNRLNQNPGNSSRPPPTAGSGASARAHAARKRTPIAPKGSGKPPGKQPGSQGRGRTQKLAVADSCAHRPESCTACGAVLAEDAESPAYTAWDEIDIAPPVEGRASRVGKEMEAILTALMAAIYAARLDPPPQVLPERYAAEVKRLQHLCEVHQTDQHPALRSVVREFLYDWKVILRPLAERLLPLSNNAAEQALRHRVILRYISHGTCSEEGARAFALLASVVETCCRRGASAWQYLGTVIAAARKGFALPALPA